MGFLEPCPVTAPYHRSSFMKKRHLMIWACICLLIVLIGMAVPTEALRSQGIGGANQANLKRKTMEVTEGRGVDFYFSPPSDNLHRIGFFFTFNGYDYTDEKLWITATAESKTLGRAEYALQDCEDDQFLFVPLSMEEFTEPPEEIRVEILSDAGSKGPSIWLNEVDVTPGSAYQAHEPVPESLIYNLIYAVKVHRVRGPVLTGLILLLFGVGVYGAGGFARPERRGKKRRALQPVLPTGREVMILGGMLLLIACAFFYLYDTQIRTAQNTTEKRIVLPADGELLFVDQEHSAFRQTVKPGEDQLTGFGVRLFLEEGKTLPPGSIHAVVTDRTLGQVLCDTEIGSDQIISGEYAGLLFRDSQTGAADHEYEIELTFPPQFYDSGLAVMTSEEGLCVSAYLYFNIFLKRFFFFLFLGVEGFACLFWYLMFVKRARLENILFVTLLFCGLVYNILLTPQMVPDEAKHMDMAYRYSNELLGYESLGDTKCLMRADDAALTFTSSPSFANYREIYYGMFSKVQDASMVEAEASSNTTGSFLLYAPAVLGMCAARMLSWGTVPMLLLARYMNLLVFALLARAGMKRLPFGKASLFVLAVLPMNVQQCTSFSHDAMVHGILIFYCCLCLQAVFEEGKLTGQQVVLLGLAAWFLVYCKSGSYLPLCLLPLLIPAARFAGRKRHLTVLFGSILAIPLLTFGMKQMQTVAGIVKTTEATSVVSVGDGSAYLSGYTLGYFVKEPLKLIYMLVNTVLDKGGFYLESLVGYKLGWVEIEISMLIVFLFWGLLLLSVCSSPGEYVRIGRWQRIVMLLACAGCTGLIFLGMLLQWTPMGHVSIEGVQGRYFLPFFLIFLAACRNKAVSLDRPMDRGIAVSAVFGQFLTLICIIRQVTMV